MRFRGCLNPLGVNRTLVFAPCKSLRSMLAQNLRAAFVTLSVASECTKTWLMDQIRHKSSAMIK